MSDKNVMDSFSDFYRHVSGNPDGFWTPHKNPLAYDNNHAKYLRQFIPLVGDYDRASHNYDQANEYLIAHGMSWDDVDPYKMASQFSLSGYTTVGRSVYRVSRNIERIYR